MNWKRWIWRLVVVLAALAIGYWLGHHSSSAPDENAGDQNHPVAQVELARIEKKKIAEDVTAYGSVIAQPGKSHSVSAAFETRVRHILVAPGEAVTVGQPLVEIDPSPGGAVATRGSAKAQPPPPRRNWSKRNSVSH